MCGICGALALAGADGLTREATLAMAAALAHRGPDGAGAWVDSAAGIALGHRRLAILDLSPAGEQPMLSASGRLVIAFNGEIYNHLDLRRRLEAQGAAPAWRGHSDTETLLAVIEAWGFVATLQACVGMFAIALWDISGRQLWLARDRLGEKPLYWGRVGTQLAFASELKALRRLPGWSEDVSPDALALFLRYGYVPAPHSIYRHVGKLEPGTWLRIGADGAEEKGSYWSVRHAAEAGAAAPFIGDDRELLLALRQGVESAVARQTVADVPVGAFLSGGIDSSVVVALMQARSSERVRTFSIGFSEAGFDEAVHARAVAAHLGTEHHELYISERETLDVVPQLPAIYDEPFADASQIPTVLLTRMARARVTVALSGDGGDELFAGYDKYRTALALWRRLEPLPLALRRLSGDGLRTLAARAQGPAAVALTGLLGRRGGLDKLHKLGRILPSPDLDHVFAELVSLKNELPQHVAGARPLATPMERMMGELALAEPLARMTAMDQVSYLPDDILVKVDRAAMAASLETRVPLLDHELVELAWRIPAARKQRDGAGKWPLRQLLYSLVPRPLVDRPKAGFAVPIGAWLRGPLRGWAEELLAPSCLGRDEWLDGPRVLRMWRDHLAGTHDWQHGLWAVLMYLAWRDSLSRGGAGG